MLCDEEAEEKVDVFCGSFNRQSMHFHGRVYCFNYKVEVTVERYGAKGALSPLRPPDKD
jgi:hypothetical protein